MDRPSRPWHIPPLAPGRVHPFNRPNWRGAPTNEAVQAGLQQDDYIHGGESNISAKARGKQRANTAAAGHSLLDVDQHYLPVTDEKLPHPMSNDEDQLDDPENGNIANHDPSHYAILRTSEAQAYLQQQLQQASPVHVQAWIDLAQRACQTLQDKNNTGRKFKRELLKPTAATAPLRKRLKDYEANMSDRDRAVAVFKLLGWIEYNGTQNEPVKQLVLSKIYGTSPSSVTKTLNRKRRILYGDEVVNAFEAARKFDRVGNGPSNGVQVKQFEEKGIPLPIQRPNRKKKLPLKMRD